MRGARRASGVSLWKIRLLRLQDRRYIAGTLAISGGANPLDAVQSPQFRFHSNSSDLQTKATVWFPQRQDTAVDDSIG